METIAISIAGHTNVGKTSLARTLLRKDIGRVSDHPHVTDLADGHILAKDDEAKLVLWDLPGFGDSARLKKRLTGAGLTAWLRSIFDRWTDRPLWCSQKCLQNAKEDADVVLYVLDALADPIGSPEVRAELEILDMISKPVVLLLNQTGLPESDRDLVLARKWRESLAGISAVRDAMSMDGWMRCWIQEADLFKRISPHLAAEKREHYDRLIRLWESEYHEATFEKAIAVIASALADTAADQVEIGKESRFERLISLATRNPTEERKQARSTLAKSLVRRTRVAMEQLLSEHRIEGVPRERLESLIEGMKSNDPTAPPELWALAGAVGSGVVVGLLADFKAGGLTLGGGAITGGILGGLGAYGLGRGYSLIKGESGAPCMNWSEDFLMEEWKAWAIRYLQVAHFGRGQGEWDESDAESKALKWGALVEEWVAGEKKELRKALKSRDLDEIRALMDSMIRKILQSLYPRSDDREGALWEEES